MDNRFREDTALLRAGIRIAGHPQEHVSRRPSGDRPGSLPPTIKRIWYIKSQWLLPGEVNHSLNKPAACKVSESACSCRAKRAGVAIFVHHHSQAGVCALWDQTAHQRPSVLPLRISIDQPWGVCVGVLGPMGTHLHLSHTLTCTHTTRTHSLVWTQSSNSLVKEKLHWISNH